MTPNRGASASPTSAIRRASAHPLAEPKDRAQRALRRQQHAPRWRQGTIVYSNGQQSGQASYDATGGSGNMNKFIKGDTKITELVNLLFPGGAKASPSKQSRRLCEGY